MDLILHGGPPVLVYSSLQTTMESGKVLEQQRSSHLRGSLLVLVRQMPEWLWVVFLGGIAAPTWGGK